MLRLRSCLLVCGGGVMQGDMMWTGVASGRTAVAQAQVRTSYSNIQPFKVSGLPLNGLASRSPAQASPSVSLSLCVCVVWSGPGVVER